MGKMESKGRIGRDVAEGNASRTEREALARRVSLPGGRRKRLGDLGSKDLKALARRPFPSWIPAVMRVSNQQCRSLNRATGPSIWTQLSWVEEGH